MSILLALALTVAPAPYDDGAQGCMAYGVFTEVVANDGNLTFEVPAPPDGFEVTAVVIGDESDPVQHEIVAPASPGQVVNAGYYIDHVHICYAQTELPEESWPDTTSTPSTTAPSSTSPATTATAPGITSTSSPTPNSTSTIETSAPSGSASSPTTTDCQEDEPCWDCRTNGNGLCGPTLPVTGVGSGLVAVWASCLIALGVALVGVTRRRT